MDRVCGLHATAGLAAFIRGLFWVCRKVPLVLSMPALMLVQVENLIEIYKNFEILSKSFNFSNISFYIK